MQVVTAAAQASRIGCKDAAEKDRPNAACGGRVRLRVSLDIYYSMLIYPYMYSAASMPFMSWHDLGSKEACKSEGVWAVQAVSEM